MRAEDGAGRVAEQERVVGREQLGPQAAVARGVLLRPLGDVVVIMPPLTITDIEIERIVTTLAEAIDDANL